MHVHGMQRVKFEIKDTQKHFHTRAIIKHQRTLNINDLCHNNLKFMIRSLKPHLLVSQNQTQCVTCCATRSTRTC